MEPVYVSASRRLPAREEHIRHLAQWIGVEPYYDRPLPTDRPGLVVSHLGARLHVPGLPPQPWHPGMSGRRRRRDEKDVLIQALDLQYGDHLLDCTLGMGHDALVAAARGATVEALEASPLILFFTLDGINRHAPRRSRRISGRCADYRVALPTLPSGAFDQVLIDPMFPPNRAGRGMNLASIRAFAIPGRAPNEALFEARRVARRWVAMKLAPYEAVPAGDGLPEAEIIESNRVRFARWPAVALQSSNAFRTGIP